MYMTVIFLLINIHVPLQLRGGMRSRIE